MIKEYLNYLKDNPNKYWFRARLYGWGWTPARWQGWVTLLAFLVLMLVNSFILELGPQTDSAVYTFLAVTFTLVAILIFICYKKGEKPRWMWGVPEKYKQDALRYVCTGGCGGVSDVAGVCQATTCAKHGQPLTNGSETDL